MNLNINKELLYLDNAATTYPKPDVFYEKAMSLFKEFGVNGSRGTYPLAEKMKDIEDNLRLNIAKVYSIKDKSKVVLTSSATYALNQILQGLDYTEIKTVYISPFEHNAVYRPLLYMQKKYGFSLELLPFNEYEWDDNKTELYYMSKKPDLVVCTHASNVFGNILPIEHIFEKSKRYGAITVLDAAQTTGLLNIDIQNSDFTAFAGHKTLLGPTGIGGFIINTSLELTPLIFGGTGILSELEEMPASIPERFEAGSMNSFSIIGLEISTNYILKTGIKKIYNKEQENLEKLKTKLFIEPDITVFKIPDNIPSVGIISILHKNLSPQELSIKLANQNVCVRSGLQCSPLAHKHMKTFPEGTVRFSVNGYKMDLDVNNVK